MTGNNVGLPAGYRDFMFDVAELRRRIENGPGSRLLGRLSKNRGLRWDKSGKALLSGTGITYNLLLHEVKLPL